MTTNRSITGRIAKRLKLEAAMRAERAQRALDDELEAIPDRAALEVRNLEAVARSEADDRQRRTDAVNANRLEQLASAGRNGGIGDVALRTAAMGRLGVTPTAIAMASSCGGIEALATDDMYLRSSGQIIRPEAALTAVVGALLYWYSESLSEDERAAQADTEKARRAKLAELADAALAEHIANRDAESRLEA